MFTGRPPIPLEEAMTKHRTDHRRRRCRRSSAAACPSPRPAPRHARAARRHKPVDIEVFAPEQGANAGIAGTGWFVDMEVDFQAGSLAATGFNGLQLTGPAGHNNIPPAPGAFGTGHDDKMPGLVVLTSTTLEHPARLLRAGDEPGRPVQPHRRHQPGLRRRPSCGTPGWSVHRSPAATSTPCSPWPWSTT